MFDDANKTIEELRQELSVVNRALTLSLTGLVLCFLAITYCILAMFMHWNPWWAWAFLIPCYTLLIFKKRIARYWTWIPEWGRDHYTEDDHPL